MSNTKKKKENVVTPWSVAQEVGKSNPHEDHNQSADFCDWLLAMSRGEKWPKPTGEHLHYLANKVIRRRWTSDQFRQCCKDIRVVQKMNDLHL